MNTEDKELMYRALRHNHKTIMKMLTDNNVEATYMEYSDYSEVYWKSFLGAIKIIDIPNADLLESHIYPLDETDVITHLTILVDEVEIATFNSNFIGLLVDFLEQNLIQVKNIKN